MMYRLRRNDADYFVINDVTHFVRNDVAPVGRNDVMFAHCAVGTTSLPKATSLGEADITCTQGQTSFGDLLYRRSPFAYLFYDNCFLRASKIFFSSRDIFT